MQQAIVLHIVYVKFWLRVPPIPETCSAAWAEAWSASRGRVEVGGGGMDRVLTGRGMVLVFGGGVRTVAYLPIYPAESTHRKTVFTEGSK